MQSNLTDHERKALRYLRVLFRHHRFTGETDLSWLRKEDAEEFERIIAHAEYELGILDPEVNERQYGFGKGVETN